LGNIAQVESQVPIRSFGLLAKQYGEIYKLNLAGNEFIVITSHALCNELSDDTRFHKGIAPALKQVRNLAGDGLFTAFHGEPNWGIAHRLLMPAFGPANVRSMFDGMMDIASQLMLKWERFGPKHVIEPSQDYTRVSLDAIALCGMNYRINSFYRETAHPFVQAMGDSLTESGLRARRPAALQALSYSANKKYFQDRDTMRELVDEIIQERRANPTEKHDVLNTMLNGVDKETGARLSDESIGYNLITFLIAGKCLDL
jgi:cytochrome P450/NADPH-cytochrome P450 reductase